MNRENKKKSYKKGYYKSHACNESFTCKVCGRLVVPNGAGSDHRNHCPYCLSSQHLDIEPGDREADAEELWNLSQYGFAKTANGRLFTAAKSAEH